MDQRVRGSRFEITCLCSCFCSGRIFLLGGSFSRKVTGRCVCFIAVRHNERFDLILNKYVLFFSRYLRPLTTYERS